MQIILCPSPHIGLVTGEGGSEIILNTIQFLDFENLWDDPFKSVFQIKQAPEIEIL